MTARRPSVRVAALTLACSGCFASCEFPRCEDDNSGWCAIGTTTGAGGSLAPEPVAPRTHFDPLPTGTPLSGVYRTVDENGTERRLRFTRDGAMLVCGDATSLGGSLYGYSIIGYVLNWWLEDQSLQTAGISYDRNRPNEFWIDDSRFVYVGEDDIRCRSVDSIFVTN